MLDLHKSRILFRRDRINTTCTNAGSKCFTFQVSTFITYHKWYHICGGFQTPFLSFENNLRLVVRFIFFFLINTYRCTYLPFNVLHTPLAVTYPQTSGPLTLTVTTSHPQIVHNAAPYSCPATTHVSPLSKKSAGQNPGGPEPSLVTPPRQRRPSTNCKLL